MKKIILVQMIVLLAVGHLGCSANQVEEKSFVLDAMAAKEVIFSGRFNVQFDSSYEVEFFEGAWSILKPKVEVTGPKSNGLMTVIVSETYEAAQVLKMIESTKGVLLVEPAFVYETQPEG